ncbi:MAG: hypothetical protein A4E60_02233 [Syntrophorhabdus sp. PtaB.Bin047]|nr:MAG: hypothetical protein A4E60_02233 [Syntrophorhabdus sp. PtaB.Bin047]
MDSTEKKFGEPKAALNRWVSDIISRFSTPMEPQKKARAAGPCSFLSLSSFSAISDRAWSQETRTNSPFTFFRGYFSLSGW